MKQFKNWRFTIDSQLTQSILWPIYIFSHVIDTLRYRNRNVVRYRRTHCILCFSIFRYRFDKNIDLTNKFAVLLLLGFIQISRQLFRGEGVIQKLTLHAFGFFYPSILACKQGERGLKIVCFDVCTIWMAPWMNNLKCTWKSNLFSILSCDCFIQF